MSEHGCRECGSTGLSPNDSSRCTCCNGLGYHGGGRDCLEVRADRMAARALGAYQRRQIDISASRRALLCLASNLAIAGALCRAHWNGARFRTCVDMDAIDWWPGCGRSAA